jgi:hypothetical protein
MFLIKFIIILKILEFSQFLLSQHVQFAYTAEALARLRQIICQNQFAFFEIF